MDALVMSIAAFVFVLISPDIKVVSDKKKKIGINRNRLKDEQAFMKVYNCIKNSRG